MIESFCCTLIAVIFYVTAGQYEDKFEVLKNFKLPLIIIAGVLAAITLLFTVFRIIDAFSRKRKK